MAWDSYPTREEWEEGKRRVAANGEAKDEAPPKHFELVPFDAIRVDTTPAYLVKGIIPREGLCVFWGPPKCGKSFLVFDLMMHVALGWEYRGRRVQASSVVYIACEGEAGLAARKEAFQQAKIAEEGTDPPFYLLTTRLDLVGDIDELIADIDAPRHGLIHVRPQNLESLAQSLGR